jgi:hypothetical protein
MTTKYETGLKKLSRTHPGIFKSLSGKTTLEGVFEWIREAGSKAGAIDLVPQDEFTHDVVVELNETGEYLVFGCT